MVLTQKARKLKYDNTFAFKDFSRKNPNQYEYSTDAIRTRKLNHPYFLLYSNFLLNGTYTNNVKKITSKLLKDLWDKLLLSSKYIKSDVLIRQPPQANEADIYMVNLVKGTWTFYGICRRLPT